MQGRVLDDMEGECNVAMSVIKKQVAINEDYVKWLKKAKCFWTEITLPLILGVIAAAKGPTDVWCKIFLYSTSIMHAYSSHSIMLLIDHVNTSSFACLTLKLIEFPVVS